VDLCFTADVFYFFAVEMHRLIGAKFCMVVSTRPNFYNAGPKFRGPTYTQKILWAKSMQNLARFRTISKFGVEYLRNRWRYSKLVKYFIYRNSSRVRRNKSGELWSSNLGDLNVKSYPPKASFYEDHISAPMRCCTPKSLHVLENDQVLLAHPAP